MCWLTDEGGCPVLPKPSRQIIFTVLTGCNIASGESVPVLSPGLPTEARATSARQSVMVLGAARLDASDVGGVLLPLIADFDTSLTLNLPFTTG